MAVPDRYRGPKPQIARGSGGSVTGILLAGLLAVAFGGGVVVAGYFWMRTPAKMSETVLSATGKSGPALAPKPVDDGSWTDSDMRDCRMQATAAAEAARKRKLAAVSADRVGLGGPDAEVVERATYLLCGATRKPLHLCDGYWRGWFIAAIKDHAKDFRAVSQSAYWSKVNVAERAKREAGGGKWQTISDDLDQTTREIGRMHDEIIAAFRSLIADGIIDPEEFGIIFGLGIPPDIGAMIGGARPLRQRCE